MTTKPGAESSAPGTAEEPEHVDILVDTGMPLRIALAADGRLNLAVCRPAADGPLVAVVRLDFSPEAAASLMGGLHKLVQAGALRGADADPPG